ncbi:MAG: hypothetical protein LR015_01405 [Verrucomicrobia bacterium]|nr:hypothetical protein [Verrucomicrobiota bacterium]
MNWKKLLLLALLPLPLGVAGQSVSYRGGLFVQSFNNPAFNSMGNTSAAWQNGVTVPGWHSTSTQITYGWAGAATSARMFGFRFDSSGDTSPVAGSLGTRTSNTTGPIHHALALQNDSGKVVDSLVVAFRAFVANSETDPGKADKISFSYKLGGAFQGEGYTAVPALDYVYAGGNDRGLPVAGTVRVLNSTLDNLNWQPGEVLWLRWTDEHDANYGGVAMGIDHLHVNSDVPMSAVTTDWEWWEADVTRVYHINPFVEGADDANPGN